MWRPNDIAVMRLDHPAGKYNDPVKVKVVSLDRYGLLLVEIIEGPFAGECQGQVSSYELNRE